jgi:EAL domain-containing protein (putative c-di-GMP-specific phosphodiesterase class I)
VLRAACGQVAAWRARHRELSVSVNVSARQMTGELVGTVAAALEESGLPASALALEITERLLLEDSPATADTLAQLRAMGVGLVLDDFGTGFSSLGYLRRFRLDGLKVDRAFVADLGADGARDAAIVEAIVGMARALGMRTTPEGVETAGQLERLRRIGCDFAQGFHLSRPLPAEALEALLGGALASAG